MVIRQIIGDCVVVIVVVVTIHCITITIIVVVIYFRYAEIILSHAVSKTRDTSLK